MLAPRTLWFVMKLCTSPLSPSPPPRCPPLTHPNNISHHPTLLTQYQVTTTPADTTAPTTKKYINQHFCAPSQPQPVHILNKICVYSHCVYRRNQYGNYSATRTRTPHNSFSIHHESRIVFKCIIKRRICLKQRSKTKKGKRKKKYAIRNETKRNNNNKSIY